MAAPVGRGEARLTPEQAFRQRADALIERAQSDVDLPSRPVSEPAKPAEPKATKSDPPFNPPRVAIEPETGPTDPDSGAPRDAAAAEPPSEPERDPLDTAPAGEGGYLRLSRPQRPAVPAGSGLADIDRMVQHDPSVPVVERLRAAKERFIETQVNRFEPVRKLTDALIAANQPPAPGEAPVQIMELAKNKTMGQAEAFSRRLQRIVKEAADHGLDASLNHYLTLKQFDKRIRDLLARPDMVGQINQNGRRTDPNTGAEVGYVNSQEFDRPKIAAAMSDLVASLGPQR